MRICAKFLAFAAFLAVNTTLYAQQGFSVAAYEQYLQSHTNVSANQLMVEYPVGAFLDTVAIDYSNVAYLDSIIAKYNLTADEELLLRKNGFVVTERLSYTNFALAFEDPWHKDLPVFVTTDAILHAVHMSYDNILKTCEKDIFEGLLKQSLQDMHSYQATLESQYGTNPLMSQSLLDADVYITVANRLAGNSTAPYYPANAAFVDELVGYCNNYPTKDIKLFSDTKRGIDFSQFKPRGHYVPSMYNFVDLRDYFKTMMWLGRIELVIGEMDPADLNYQPVVDIRRQAVLSCLLQEAIENTGAKDRLAKIDSTLTFIVGESDNVTLSNLSDLRTLAGVTTAAELHDPVTFAQFQNALKTAPFAAQKINSQLLLSDPFDTYQVKPASAFLVMGQRFVIDSYVLGNVVFDRVMHDNKKVKRMLPDPLDAMFALGNNASAQLLTDGLDTYHYGQNLAGLRYLVDSYEDDFWDNSLYNYWLNGIRALNPRQDRSAYPQPMQTAAWWQEKLNTQLASWAQLRHDNILYAKQSYSSIYGCSYPEAYLEPYPELYSRLGRFAREAHTVFTPLVADGAPPSIATYYERFANTMDSLTVIAQMELAGQPLSTSQITFLQSVMHIWSGCAGSEYSGWYPGLFFFLPGQPGFKEVDTDDATIADVHTSASDEYGNEVGWVLHAGTGKVNTCIMIAPSQNGGFTAYTGPVLSYYEHTTTGFERLTDGEWEPMVMPQTLPRPDWTNIYLANKNGLMKTGGRQLLTVSSLPAIAALEFAIDTLRIRQGNSESIQITIRDIFGLTVQRTLSWSATGGTVSSTGTFTAGSTNGVYQLTAMAPDSTVVATLPVRIYPVLASIEGPQELLADEVGYEIPFPLKGIGVQGEEVELLLDWHTLRCTYTGHGTVIPTEAGTPFIRVTDTLSGLTFEGMVKAYPVPSRIEITPADIAGRLPVSMQFSAQAFDAQGRAAENEITWSTSMGAIDESGNYTSGASTGYTTVQAWNMHKTVFGTAAVRILPTLATFDIGPDTLYLNPGDTWRFTASGTSTDGLSAEVFLEWDASHKPQNGNTYTMPQCNGAVLMVASDMYAPEIRDSVWVLPTTEFKSLHISAPLLTRANIPVSIKTNGLDCNDTYREATVMYTSSFGTIDEAGVFDPQGITGSCSISATERRSPLSGNATILVQPALSGIVVSPDEVTTLTGKNVNLVAEGYDPQNQHTQLFGTWSCDGGTITHYGTFTAPTAPGEYRVWFTDTLAHMADTAIVTVDEATGLDDVPSPATISLAQNYPNPFNPATTIEYTVPSRMHVSLGVFDNLGQQVATLVNAVIDAGTHRVQFDASGMPSGVYFYRLEAYGVRITKSMVVMK